MLAGNSVSSLLANSSFERLGRVGRSGMCEIWGEDNEPHIIF